MIYADLGKPLVSKVKIDGKIQHVQYESFPLVCFECGRWGHNKESYTHTKDQRTVQPGEEGIQQSDKVSELQRRVEDEDFGSWMLVERKQRRRPRPKENPIREMRGGMIGGSRFGVLDADHDEKSGEDLGGVNEGTISGRGDF